MRKCAILALIGAVALIGCEKQQEPETIQVGEPQTDMRSIDDLAPVDEGANQTYAGDGGVVQPETTYTGSATYEDTAGDYDQPATPTWSEPEPMDEVAQPSPEANTYVIRKGDTLWSIAKRKLGSGRRWKEIVDENPGLDPQRLVIGKVIRLPRR
jgi:LysM repeat protein